MIDWNDGPADPVFQLTFPQRGMLRPEHFDKVAELMRREADAAEMKPVNERIRGELNPHPAGQLRLGMIPDYMFVERDTVARLLRGAPGINVR